jgi:hypothetical protein
VLRAAFLLAMAFLAAPAQAAPARALADCEKLTNWHAYNTCLASFGPRRGQRAARGQPPADGAEARVDRRAPSARRGAPGMVVQRVQGGRVRASFDVGAPRRVR